MIDILYGNSGQMLREIAARYQTLVVVGEDEGSGQFNCHIYQPAQEIK